MQDEIVSHYSGGKNMSVIARQYGISSSSVARVLKRKNVDTTVPPYTLLRGESEKPICEQYKGGASLTKLAKQNNLSVTGIHKILKRNGVERRRRGGKVREVPDHIVQDILTRFADGESQQSIADTHGFRQVHVSRIVKLHQSVPHSWQHRRENLELRNGKHGKGQCLQCAECGSRNLIPVALIEDGAGI